jgi:D-3-phosphoglycerate dehydrogenase
MDNRLLVSAFCAGLVGDKIEGANIVNAELLCRERGIDVVRKSTAEHGAFSSVISANVIGDGQAYKASATVFGKNMPRLIGLGDYRTESYMDGILLVFTHKDVPGIIGFVGKVLADENVNIAQMAVGREGAAGSHAVGILNLDSPASQTAIEKVLTNPAIQSAKLIQLPAVGELPDWLS